MSPRKPALTHSVSTPMTGKTSPPKPKVHQKTLINALLDLKQQQVRHERTIEKLFTTVQFLLDKLEIKERASAMVTPVLPSPAATPRTAARGWLGDVDVSCVDGTLIEL